MKKLKKTKTRDVEAASTIEEQDSPDRNIKCETNFRSTIKTWINSFRPSSTLPLFIVVFCLYFGYAQAVAECMSGNNLKCFECNSHENDLCKDPFNWTTLPPLKQCDGCCVKMVQGIGTPDMKIRRGCTADIDINMFMVDHVCMAEGGGKGRMCFCEENQCNRAMEKKTISAWLTTASTMLCLTKTIIL